MNNSSVLSKASLKQIWILNYVFGGFLILNIFWSVTERFDEFVIAWVSLIAYRGIFSLTQITLITSVADGSWRKGRIYGIRALTESFKGPLS